MLNVCQQRMVADHIKRMHEVCSDYVRTEKKKDLANMYQLLKPISGGNKADRPANSQANSRGIDGS